MDHTSLFYSLGGYAIKLTHIFGSLIWIGGVLFMGGVATPILRYYASPEHSDPRVADVIGRLERRLVGFNWMGLCSALLSGIALSYFSAEFSWLRFQSLFDYVIHLKILLFMPIALVNYLLGVSYRELLSVRQERLEGEYLAPREIVDWRIVALRRINVYLAFTIILLLALL